MKSRSIVLIILLIIILVTIWWCKSPNTADSRQRAADKILPNLNVTSVTITGITNDLVQMDCRILLENPLLINLNTKRISYRVFIDSVQILQNEYNEPLIINSGDTSTIELQVELSAEPLTEVLSYFEKNKIDSAEYSVHAILELDLPVAGEKEIKINFSRRLPALKIPKVELIDLDLNLLQLRKKGVDVVLQVHNPNLFELHLHDGRFDFYLDDYFALRGILEPDIELPPGSTKEIAVNANIQDSNIPKTGWELLTGQDAPFTLRFKGILRSENKMLDQSKLDLIVNGRVSEIRELMKKRKSK